MLLKSVEATMEHYDTLGASRPEAYYDAETRINWLEADLTADGAELRSLSGMLPTAKGHLAFHGYVDKSTYSEDAPVIRRMIHSVALAPELAYRVRWTDKLLTGSDASDEQLGSLVGAFVGVAVGFALFLYWRRKRAG